METLQKLDLLPPLAPEIVTDDGSEQRISGLSTPKIEIDRFGRLVNPKPFRQLEALLNRVDRMNADILVVQEIENIRALKEFNTMLDAPYPYVALNEGNDPRNIDVGLLSKYPIKSTSSYRWVPDPIDSEGYLFSRDLMRADIGGFNTENSLISIYIAHLKSQFIDFRIEDDAEREAAERNNNERREAQANAVKPIIHQNHDTGVDNIILCGDLNDHPNSTPLKPLISDLGLHDVMSDNLDLEYERPEGEGPRHSNEADTPASDDWMHRYQRSGAPDKFERLDYLLVSPRLKNLVIKAAIQRRTHWDKTGQAQIMIRYL